MNKKLIKAQLGVTPQEGIGIQNDMAGTIFDSLMELVMRGVTGESGTAQAAAAPQPGEAAPGMDFSALLGEQNQLHPADELSILLDLMGMFQEQGTTPGQPGQTMLRPVPDFLNKPATQAPTWNPQGLGYPGNIMGYDTAAIQANQAAESDRINSIIQFLVGTQYQAPGTNPQPPDMGASAQSAKDFLDRYLGRPTDAQTASQTSSAIQNLGGQTRGLMDFIMSAIMGGGQEAQMAPPQYSSPAGPMPEIPNYQFQTAAMGPQMGPRVQTPGQAPNILESLFNAIPEYFTKPIGNPLF